MFKRIIDIVAWLGVTLVLVSVAIRFAKPEWPFSYFALAGLVCILVYAVADWREILRMFGGRAARLGTISIVSVLVVLGILSAINYISSRENKRWDLTEGGEFTLSPQTAKVVKGLDSPLKMTVFARETDFARYKERLPEYEYLSKKVSVEYVDPDKKPALAKQMAVQSYGTIAIEYKGRVERVTNDSEQDIANGIIKVVTGQERKVYFTQGHGEKDTTSAERTGYNAIAAQLGRDNYKVEKVALAQQGEVPTDASVLVAAGPKTDFLPQEVEALKRYLARGGKLLLMLDPPEKGDSAQVTNLVALAREWAIEVGNNVVVDVSGVGRLLGTDETVPVAVSYPTHPIVNNFELLTAFPMARSVSGVSGGANGRFAQAFVETSARSWAETDMASLSGKGQIKFEEDKGDKRGPISVAAAVSAPAQAAVAPAANSKDAKDAKAEKKDEGPKPETRVAVIGDSDFAANFALGIQGNRDLFMNTVSWLAQQENLIAVRPKESSDRRITMTGGQQTRVTLLVALIPLVIFGTGIYSWWRRR